MESQSQILRASSNSLSLKCLKLRSYMFIFFGKTSRKSLPKERIVEGDQIFELLSFHYKTYSIEFINMLSMRL